MRSILGNCRLCGDKEASIQYCSTKYSICTLPNSFLVVALCAAILSGCASDSNMRRSAAAGVERNAEPNKRASSRPGAHASVQPLPPALLKAQPEPDCTFKPAGEAAVPGGDASRAKLDYERQCYRNAELDVRDRLRQLQDFVGQMFETLKRSVGFASLGPTAAVAAQAGSDRQPGNDRATEPFRLTSTAFRDGDVWPSKYAGSDPSRTNPPCPGQNVSPPLAWSNVPAATKSFAIFMSDPDGNNGLGVDHWVAYDIPASKTSLSEGEASVSPKTWVGGKNAIGSDHYFGPCGPAGHALHHYVITVVASDIPPGTLMPGLTHAELVQQLRGHALAPASIVGRYTRPSP